MTLIFAWVGLATIAANRCAGAITLTLPVVTNLSQAVVTLDALGRSDADTTSLAGSVILRLDQAPGASTLVVEDFRMSALQPLDFDLNLGLAGRATARVPVLRVERNGSGGVPLPVEGTNGSFVLHGTSYRTFGSASYSVSGLACSLVIKPMDLPCADTLKLEDAPPGTLDELGVKLTYTGGKVRAVITFFFVQPLDAESPDLGTVSGTVTAVAEGPYPILLEAVARPGGRVLLRWPRDTGLQLVGTASLQSPVVWKPVGGLPITNGDFLELEFKPAAPKAFLRLQ